MREWQKVDSALEASLPVLLLPCTELSFGSSVVEVLVLFRLICVQGNTGSRSKEWFRKLNMSNLQVCLHLWTCDGKKATDEVAEGLGYKSMEINPGSSQSLVMSLPENGNKILAHTSCWVWKGRERAQETCQGNTQFMRRSRERYHCSSWSRLLNSDAGVDSGWRR